MDTYSAHWRRLQSGPLNGNWFAVMQDADEHRLPGILDFARKSLPLEELGSGPGDESARRERFREHSALDAIVTRLADYPGEGWDIVETCLRSPVIRNRNMAINTLETWTPAAWPAAARTALMHALTAEPDDSVRKRLSGLIR